MTTTFQGTQLEKFIMSTTLTCRKDMSHNWKLNTSPRRMLLEDKLKTLWQQSIYSPVKDKDFLQKQKRNFHDHEYIHCLLEHFHFSTNRPDLLAVLVCLFGFIIFNINYILLETIGVPLCQQQLGSNNVDKYFTNFHKGCLPRLILQFKTKGGRGFKGPLNNVENSCNIFRNGLP